MTKKIAIMKIKNNNQNINTRKLNIKLNFEFNKIFPIIEIIELD